MSPRLSTARTLRRLADRLDRRPSREQVCRGIGRKAGRSHLLVDSDTTAHIEEAS